MKKDASKNEWIRITLLVIGILFSLWLFLFADLVEDRPAVSRTAAIAVLMATLWITEWIPLAATAMLPVVLFPIAGVQDGKTVSSAYFDYIVFLFIGGFIVALAMQKWDLHRRIALQILPRCGTGNAMILFGFMLATAVLSMWISNTAATMMMVTIASAVLMTITGLKAHSSDETDRSSNRFSHAILLGVAYSASIGGIATIVGTPPNLAFWRIYKSSFPDSGEVGFVSWMAVAIPISVCLFVITWLVLYLFYLRRNPISGVDREQLRQQLKSMGPVTFPQGMIAFVFATLVLLWVTRAGIRFGDLKIPGWSSLFESPRFINDGTVAIAAALLLFLIPSFDGKRGRIMDWEATKGLPWNIVLLFGGGFALAGAIRESGLSAYLGEQMSGLGGLHPILLLAVVCLAITFITELTSNTATTEMILPLMASLSLALDIHPLILMIPVTISCSCAFMMPVATPPNAIVFGTGKIQIREMVRVGLVLNLIAVVVVVLLCSILVPSVFGNSI